MKRRIWFSVLALTLSLVLLCGCGASVSESGGEYQNIHLVMAVNDSVELSLVTLVALKSQLRSRNQLVRDAAEGTDNHYYRPVFGLFLYNFL